MKPNPHPHPLPRTALEPVCPALATTIRKRRQRAGLSLGQLAARAQLSRQMLSFIESQRRIPTLDTVARISRAFGLPLSRLLTLAERELHATLPHGRTAAKLSRWLALLPATDCAEFFSCVGWA